MDAERKRKLKEEYKQMKTEMGVYAFRCIEKRHVYLGASQNLDATLNSIRFQLKNNGFLTNRRLEADWRAYGPEGFSEEILEKLDYDKDNDTKTDYREDLAVLKEFWRESLEKDGFTVENIKPVDR